MKKIFLSAFLLMFAITVAAKADTLTLTGVNGATDANGQVYIDPYYATLNGSSITVYCVDPQHDSSIGGTWSVWVTPLTGDLSNTYLGNNGLTQYKEMAWLLFDAVDGQGNGYLGMSLTDRQDVQAAVWYIAYPSANNPIGSDNGWVSTAAANYQSGNYSNIDILTDIRGVNQELMTDPPPVPEPASLLLLGTGLLGFGGVMRKRLKR